MLADNVKVPVLMNRYLSRAMLNCSFSQAHSNTSIRRGTSTGLLATEFLSEVVAG